jgi:hypothetical protein
MHYNHIKGRVELATAAKKITGLKNLPRKNTLAYFAREL